MLRFVCLAFGIFMSVLVFSEEIDFDKYFYTPTSQCMEEFNIKQETLDEAMKTKGNKNIDPCFLACDLKHKSFMNEKGMFDVDQTDTLLANSIKNQDHLENMKQKFHMCSAVNDEEFSDDKGCERAALLMKCIHKH